MTPETMNTIVASAAAVAVPTLIGLGGIAIAYLRQKTGLQVTQVELQREANLRDSLQSSLVTAVGMYTLGKKDEAIQYVATHSADALKHFAFSDADVAGLIVNKAAAWAGVPAPAVQGVPATVGAPA